ncbi:gp56 [Alphaproteobacteria phage PhiJL001]|uniref:Gp56 n=1 Tax=Alphaproteobacteria phage PhiJL001 TaxID=2681607 RepID=Q5DN49_9CAUD|nr:gp56 [Alphaproteobacteria phage PhiJL001]AAT69532.1 gp56 [Alphaproteobacteria phage PhiJL001]
MMGLSLLHWYLIGAICSGEMMIWGMKNPVRTKPGQPVFPSLLLMYLFWPLFWLGAVLGILLSTGKKR